MKSGPSDSNRHHPNSTHPKPKPDSTPPAIPPVVLLYRVRFLAAPLAQTAPTQTTRTQTTLKPARTPPIAIPTLADLAPLSLSAAADEPPKARRPTLSRRQPRLGAGGPRRRLKFTAKRLGEIAEAFFLAKAADLGFTVLKPWGDSEAYDFVLDAHHGAGGFSRVQVKSAHRKGPADKGYSFSAHDFSLHAYSERDVDAFIAYVVPEDVWYVIPIRDLKNTRGIHLFPTSRRRRSKYEKYRDAWWHLEK